MIQMPKVTKEQAIKCAMSDLIGSLQAKNQSDIHVHDWRSHLESIQDLYDAFPEVCKDYEAQIDKL